MVKRELMDAREPDSCKIDLKTQWYPKLERIRANFLEEQLSPKARHRQSEAFAVRFTYDTQRMDGSRLTFTETSNLLYRGIIPDGRSLQDYTEAVTHKNLFNRMFSFHGAIDIDVVLEWHREFFEQTRPNVAGRLRDTDVLLTGSDFSVAAPADIPKLFDEFFIWYNENKDTMHPVELAALVHLKFLKIHPLNRGNGKIARLLANFVLKEHGYPMLDIRESDRASYYDALDEASVSGSNEKYLEWFFETYARENIFYGRDTMRAERIAIVDIDNTIFFTDESIMLASVRVTGATLTLPEFKELPRETKLRVVEVACTEFQNTAVPNPTMIDRLKELKLGGYRIILLSGRGITVEASTVDLLGRYGVEYDELYHNPDPDIRDLAFKSSMISKLIGDAVFVEIYDDKEVNLKGFSKLITDKRAVGFVLASGNKLLRSGENY